METPEDMLCRQCGLCCDGSLFADVIVTEAEIQPIETRVGYERRDDRVFLQQPCQAFCEGKCQVYPDRPAECRSFECELLRQVKVGETQVSTALYTIKTVREKIRFIEDLLNQLGEEDSDLPLSFRYETALSQAWDLTESKSVQEKREQLFALVTELDSTLQDRFRSSD
jgi:uncharacterized protein